MVRRYPLAAFLLIAFAITWSIAGLAWGLHEANIWSLEAQTAGRARSPGALPGTVSGAHRQVDPVEVSWWVYPVMYLAIWGPTLSGLIVAWKLGRLKTLLARLAKWKVGITWWLAALLLAPIIEAAGLGLSSLYEDVSFVRWLPQSLTSLAIFLGAGILSGPLGEELGWRGTALPRLASKMPPLAAALLLGIVWALWHLPAFVVPGVDRLVLPPGFSYGPFFIHIVALSVLIAWVFFHARCSVLLAAVMHLSVYPALLSLNTMPDQAIVWTTVGLFAVVATGVGIADPTLGYRSDSQAP